MVEWAAEPRLRVRDKACRRESDHAAEAAEQVLDHDRRMAVHCVSDRVRHRCHHVNDRDAAAAAPAERESDREKLLDRVRRMAHHRDCDHEHRRHVPPWPLRLTWVPHSWPCVSSSHPSDARDCNSEHAYSVHTH